MAIVSIEGKFILDDGEEVRFSIDRDDSMRWGNTIERIGETVDLAEALTEAAYEHLASDDDLCADCGAYVGEDVLRENATEYCVECDHNHREED